jgi:hypothetical protein
LSKNITIHRDYALVNLGFRFLIYPLNTSFIRNLDPVFIDKWIRAGWETDKTVFLELDHKTIPASNCPESPASGLFSGIIYAWNAGRYLKLVAFTKGYFDNIDEVNLKVDCWHEQRHVRSAEDYVYDGSTPPAEEDVVQEEVKHTYGTLGETAVKTRSDYIHTSMERDSNVEAVLGHVVVLFLREFFEGKISNYRFNSTPIPQNVYTAAMKETNHKMISRISDFYAKVLRIDPSTIFRHSLSR